jgi:hypothetical protein
LKLCQNPVTNLNRMVHNLKRRIIWTGLQNLLNLKLLLYLRKKQQILNMFYGLLVNVRI